MKGEFSVSDGNIGKGQRPRRYTSFSKVHYTERNIDTNTEKHVCIYVSIDLTTTGTTQPDIAKAPRWFRLKNMFAKCYCVGFIAKYSYYFYFYDYCCYYYYYYQYVLVL